MKARELAAITGGALSGDPGVHVKGFSIDSRRIREGEVFLALKGRRQDGHDFISEAFEKGAVGAISEREVMPPEGKFVLKVPSTCEALNKIAKHTRESFRGKVVGVAGSAGKTTTKELIHHLLSSVAPTFRSEGNLNSQIGLPLVLSNMDLKADFAVLELGASMRGEVLRLTKLARPSVRVITALGEEHLETFGSVEDVIAGNGEIFYDFSDEDRAVLPYYAKDYYRLPEDRVITFGEGDLKPERVELTVEGVIFHLLGERFKLPILSLGAVENALASFAVLTALGMDPRDFRDRTAEFRPPAGRMNLLKFKDFYLIDDTYNANPPSVRNAIKTIASLRTESKKVVVLGDMLELGGKSRFLHEEVGALIKEMGIDFAIFYGRDTYYSYRELIRRGGRGVFLRKKEDVAIEMLKWLGDGNIILLKGSRGMRMETLIQYVKNHVGEDTFRT